MKKCMIVCISAMLLSGCTAQFKSFLEDYKGPNPARIRVAAHENVQLTFYEKQPTGCYKDVLTKRITSGVAILGVPVTGSKKIGMPSSANQAYMVNEFTIKPEVPVLVMSYWTESGYYANTERSASSSFVPQANHDYDIVITGTGMGSNSVSIKDLDPNSKIVSWKDRAISICD